MVLFPNCKINLGLNIIRKRADGYHDLETVFYPLNLKDAIEIIERPIFKFSSSGLAIDGSGDDNLCVKAYSLLKEYFTAVQPVHLHLHKTIPIGAGLGGGSSDGAFTLKLLNRKFDLRLSEKQLIDYSLKLGSDCPFFIINKPCFATGRGEALEEINVDLRNYKIVIVHPGIHINTAASFENIHPGKPKIGLKHAIQEPIVHWKENLKNDFEESVFKKHPEIKKVKEVLYDAGAIYASMSGSGSSVFGIFEMHQPLRLSFPETYSIMDIEG